MDIVPLTLTDADRFIRTWHRDHKHHPPIDKLARFSLGLLKDGELVGAIIVGFPIARATDLHQVAEVTRLAADGTPNASSQLLAAAARVVKEMGFARFQMFVEQTEVSAPSFLKAAKMTFDGETSASDWSHDRKKEQDRRERRESTRLPKHRWVMDFHPVQTVTPGRRKCDACKRLLPLGARPNMRTCSSRCRQKLHRNQARYGHFQKAS